MLWVDLPALKARMEIDHTRRDAQLQQILNGAIAAVKSFIGRDIALQEYTEQYDGNGRNRIILRQYPVVSVVSVTVGGMLISNWRNDDWLLICDRGIFNTGTRNIGVTYIAGYDPIPADIADACLMIAMHQLSVIENNGVQSKSLAGETITYSNFTQSKGIPPAALNILRAYERKI